jgi:hypothetical protein
MVRRIDCSVHSKDSPPPLGIDYVIDCQDRSDTRNGADLKLCELCQSKIQSQPRDVGTDYKLHRAYHQNVSELFRGANLGCVFCKKVAKGICWDPRGAEPLIEYSTNRQSLTWYTYDVSDWNGCYHLTIFAHPRLRTNGEGTYLLSIVLDEVRG